MAASTVKIGLFRRFWRLMGLAIRDHSGRVPAADCENETGLSLIALAAAGKDAKSAAIADPLSQGAKAIASKDRFMLPARIASVNALNPPRSRAGNSRLRAARIGKAMPRKSAKPTPKKVIKRHVRIARAEQPSANVTVLARPAARPGRKNNALHVLQRAA